MAKLIIANNDDHRMSGDSSRLTLEQRMSRPIAASRLAWLLEPGDVLLVPRMPSEAFLEYALALLGVSRDSVEVVVPPAPLVDGDGPFLSGEILRAAELRHQLLPLVCGRCDEALAYHFEDCVMELVAGLGIDVTPAQAAYVKSGGPWRLNSKVAFRELAARAGARLAPGAICRSGEQLLESMSRLVDETGSAIVKQDRNTSGWGNIVVTRDADVYGAGASSTMVLGPDAQLPVLADSVWRHLTDTVNTALVVEVFYRDAGSYYTEVAVGRERDDVRLVGFGEQRMDPIWSGFEIPSPNLRPAEAAELVSVSLALAEAARAVGFWSLLSIDAIQVDGRIVFNELNARLGGCTPVHHIASSLIGPDFMERCVILTRNGEPSSNFQETLENLSASDLLYPNREGEGVVITADDTERTESIGYMVIGSNRDRAYGIEAHARAAVARVDPTVP